MSDQLHAPATKEGVPGAHEIASWVDATFGRNALERKKILASAGNRTTNPRSPSPLPHYYINYAIASSLFRYQECNKCAGEEEGE